MPTEKSYKIRTKGKNLFLRVTPGHFATSHSHISYYIDVTMQKARLSEAKAVADELVSYYSTDTVIDTILCLDGMQVIGTCMADKLTEAGFMNMNAHKTIYVLTPEHTSGSQLIFRDTLAPMVTGKNVLILAASVATGYTARAAIEAIKYYGGGVAGIAGIYAAVSDCMGHPVRSVFNTSDLDGYCSVPSHECPMCQAGKKLDGLVNSFGLSKL